MKNRSTGRLGRLFNAVIPECFYRGSQPYEKTTRFPITTFGNDVSRGYLRGFTLIELLVVVLIIGVLTAIALPQYEKAVWKSRAAPLQIWATKLLEAEERYKMANGSYNLWCLNELDLDYSATFPRVLATHPYFGDSCINSVATEEGKTPGMIMDLDYGWPKVIFASGKYKRNGFGVNLGLSDTDRKVGGMWKGCGGVGEVLGDHEGWKKLLLSWGFTRVVVANYLCYQQLNAS